MFGTCLPVGAAGQEAGARRCAALRRAVLCCRSSSPPAVPRRLQHHGLPWDRIAWGAMQAQQQNPRLARPCMQAWLSGAPLLVKTAVFGVGDETVRPLAPDGWVAVRVLAAARMRQAVASLDLGWCEPTVRSARCCLCLGLRRSVAEEVEGHCAALCSAGPFDQLGKKRARRLRCAADAGQGWRQPMIQCGCSR